MQNITPDHAEEALGDTLDDAVPTRGYQLLPVVGVGGSAGGLEALRGFFSSTSANPGVAFVVVMHLSPETKACWPKCCSAARPCGCCR